MIQEYLSSELAQKLPGLEWTVDYYTSSDDTGTVFVTSGSRPDVYDTEYRYPSYQIYIRSSDWDYAKNAAEKAHSVLHKSGGFEVRESNRSLHVFLIEAQSEPLRIGVKDNVMEYSVNLEVTLIKRGG